MHVWVHDHMFGGQGSMYNVSLFFFFFEMVSHQTWSSSSEPQGSTYLCSLVCRDYSHMPPVSGFYMGSGDWTGVLLLACQALYCLNHVPSPSFSVLKEFLVENHLLIFSTLKFCFSDFLWYAFKIYSDTRKNLKCCFPCCLLPKPSYVMLSRGNHNGLICIISICIIIIIIISNMYNNMCNNMYFLPLYNYFQEFLQVLEFLMKNKAGLHY